MLEKHKEMLLEKARAERQEFWMLAFEGIQELMNSDGALLDTYSDAMVEHARHRGLINLLNRRKRKIGGRKSR